MLLEIRQLMESTLKKDEFMGIADGKIVTTHASLEEVTKSLLT